MLVGRFVLVKNGGSYFQGRCVRVGRIVQAAFGLWNVLSYYRMDNDGSVLRWVVD